MTEQLLESVRSKYGAVAESTLSSKDAGVKAVAEAFGYSTEELTMVQGAPGSPVPLSSQGCIDEPSVEFGPKPHPASDAQRCRVRTSVSDLARSETAVHSHASDQAGAQESDA
jgi:hypothetical protein